MRREHFDHLIAAAAQVSGEKEIVVGSQAILGAVDEPPESMVLSMEADIYPHHDRAKAEQIDASQTIDGMANQLEIAQRAEGGNRRKDLGETASAERR